MVSLDQIAEVYISQRLAGHPSFTISSATDGDHLHALALWASPPRVAFDVATVGARLISKSSAEGWSRATRYGGHETMGRVIKFVLFQRPWRRLLPIVASLLSEFGLRNEPWLFILIDSLSSGLMARNNRCLWVRIVRSTSRVRVYPFIIIGKWVGWWVQRLSAEDVPSLPYPWTRLDLRWGTKVPFRS